jgi:5-methylcytosine-specific restriction endonuclease McrA
VFIFEFIRKQTRYKQVNYVRTPYSVYIKVSSCSHSINFIKQRYDELSKIDFQCTLSEYNCLEQRKLMTKSLRDSIAERDNYTCQICGKNMADGVGLHIDHIVSVKKGGKSIPSNLQVLCSKCNGKKSTK